MAKERRIDDGRVVRNPKILGGKPVVRGTRIPVELVLKHLAQNPNLDDLFAAYPRLTVDDVKACLAYAQVKVERERPKRVHAAVRGASAAPV